LGGRSPGRRRWRIYLLACGLRRAPYLLLAAEYVGLLTAAPEAALLPALLFLHRIPPGN
jgi:hypothetical protein